MRVALIAPPFISVPPKHYGGTELFLAHLAEGLQKLSFDVVLYTNGESTLETERKFLFEEGEWPIKGEVHDSLKDLNHTSWSMADAAADCDLIHLNNVPGIANSRFIRTPVVYTIHHVHEDSLSEFYEYFPKVNFVTISEFQRQRERMTKIRTIHHGIDLELYRLNENKGEYLSFMGRIAPMKGTHLAIQAAKLAGIPLKIAGEVQPLFREYFEREVKPHVDGKFIEYVGPADLKAKNEILGGSMAMLFPIQWDEPFGLVMVEAMACGTPVLALPGGSVPEIVRDGLSGRVCASVEEMAAQAQQTRGFIPKEIRTYAQQHFSIERMVREYADLYAEIAGVTTSTGVKGILEEKRAVA